MVKNVARLIKEYETSRKGMTMPEQQGLSLHDAAREAGMDTKEVYTNLRLNRVEDELACDPCKV